MDYFQSSMYLYVVCELVGQLFSPMTVKEKFCWKRDRGETRAPVLQQLATVITQKCLVPREPWAELGTRST